jgi:hypothetical protein
MYSSKITKQVLKGSLMLSTVALLATSCNNNGTKEGEVVNNDSAASGENIKTTAKKVFYSVPSPVELAALISKSGSKYDKNLLSDINNVSKYTTNESKALNLGVYAADLSYTSAFDQTQETMFYLQCSKKLADDLGVSNAFNKSTIERIETNINVKDSLMQIISDAYFETDSYLQENERPNISALVISGGWIEGLYLAAKLSQKNPDNKEVVGRVLDQKMSLENLLGLLSTYPEDEAINSIVTKLKELQEIFNSLPSAPQTGKTEVVTNSETNVTSIGSDVQKPSISKEQLSTLTAKIEKIRTDIIK